MAGLAALMCGVFMIVARLIRLGFIANFLSHSVLIGFLTGVGIQVALGQFGGLFGVARAAAPRSRSSAMRSGHRGRRDEPSDAGRVHHGAGHHRGPGTCQQEDPGRPDRGRRA